MKMIIFYFILCLICVSCSLNNDFNETVSMDKATMESENFISLDEAIVNAKSFFESMPGYNTRSERCLRPSSVEILKRENIYKTRSNGSYETAKFYVVNFGINEGYAILSADSRLKPVFAFNDSGSISLADTINNKGLKDYFDIITSITPEVTFSSSGNFPGIPPISSNDIEGVVVAPLLSNYIRDLHQNSPYNLYCPIIDGEYSAVGCGPLAMGMISSFYKYPNQINGLSLNWDLINSGKNEDSLSKYLSILGNENYLNSNYGINGTSTDISYICKALERLGYSDVNNFSFNESLACSKLQSRQPLLVTGFGSVGGHAWVIDGLFMKYVETVGTITDDGTNEAIEETTYYYHCVWGHGGTSNGYYLYDESIGGVADYLSTGESKDYFPVFSRLRIYSVNL